MKKLLGISLVMLLSVVGLQAQNNQRMMKEKNICTTYNLTEKQQAELKEFNTKQREKMQELRKERQAMMKTIAEKQKGRYDAMHKDRAAFMKKLLSPEDYKKWEARQKQRLECRADRMGKGSACCGMHKMGKKKFNKKGLNNGNCNTCGKKGAMQGQRQGRGQGACVQQ